MWQTTLALANKVWEEFKNGILHFLALAVALSLILAWSLARIGRAVRQQDFAAQSLLRSSIGAILPARNARLGPGGAAAGRVDGHGGEDSGGPHEDRTYLPPEARVVVTPKNPKDKLEDVVNIRISGSWGPAFEPGLDLVMLPLGVGLDAKVFYYGRLGLEVGGEKYFVLSKRTSPTVGVSYHLDWIPLMRNTELKISYAPLSDTAISAALRLSF